MRKLISLILSGVMLFSSASGAFAAGKADFPDVPGHWAEEQLIKACEDELLKGYDDGTLKPNAPITNMEMLTVVTRLLGAEKEIDNPEMYGIKPDQWFSETAAKSVYLGLLGYCGEDNFKPAPRQKAMAMIGKAFSLASAAPDYSVLDKFYDNGSISPENRPYIAAMVSQGIVIGSDGGLNVNGYISRGEFVTILYRIVENYVDSSDFSSTLKGGTMIRGDAYFRSFNNIGKIWFDCSSENIQLSGVNADRIIIRSHNLKQFELSDKTRIEELVLDCGKGYIEIPETVDFSIGTIKFSGKSGGNISSGANNIEVIGNNINLSISGKHENVIVSGNNCSISLDPSSDIGNLKILGTGNVVSAKDSYFINSVNVSGSNNNISLDVNNIINIITDGVGSRISLLSDSHAENLTLSGDKNLVSVEYGSSLTKAIFNGTNAVLILDGTASEITAEGKGNQLDGSGALEKLILKTHDFTNAGSLQIAKTEDLMKYDVDRILALVSDKYQGDFTLKWAQEHDYQTYEKEIWVNAKGYASNTDYLVWINVAMQRVNIFLGSKGNWSLIRSFIVGTGAPGMDTPKGVWYLSNYRHTTGWYGKGYHCRPVVGFRVGYSDNYAFHSRLYYPDTTTLCDDRIGFPVSHGCIRMYDEDVWFMYNYLPVGTPVIVH